MGLLSGAYAKLILAGIILVAILGYGEWRNSAGYNKADALWSAKYNERENELLRARMAETERQLAANQAAKKAEAERIAKIEAEKLALENLIKELSNEADADPAADNVCLSPDAGVRINKVR